MRSTWIAVGWMFSVLAKLAAGQAAQLFVNDIQSNPGQLYAVNLSTLSLIPSSPLNGLVRLEALSFNGTELVLYDEGVGGLANFGRLWTLSNQAAPATLAGATGLVGAEGLAFNPVTGLLHTLHSIVGGTVHNVVTASGAFVSGGFVVLPPPTVGGSSNTGFLREIAVSPTGLIVASRSLFFFGDIGTIDPLTQIYTPFLSTVGAAGGLAFDPTTSDLYFALEGFDTLHRYSFTTMTTTLLGTLSLPGGGAPGVINAMAFASFNTSPATLETVGAGCGQIPLLGSVGGALPILGSPNFAFRVANAPVGAPVLFFIANMAQLDALPLGSGCSVHLDLNSLLFYWSLGVNPLLATMSDANGIALFGFPIPANPLLSGGSFGLQALVIDTLAPLGLSLSAALGVTYGS